MKKILISIFLTFFLFFSLAFQTSAQLPQLSIPGVNCGVAGDVRLNRCCMVIHPTAPNPDSTGIAAIDSVVNFLFGTIPNLFLNKVQPLVNYEANLSQPCAVGVSSTTDPADPACRCIASVTPSPGNYLVAMNDFCQRQTSSADQLSCVSCANEGGVYTGIGCVKTDLQQFIQQTVFGFGIGLAGGFALLCIIYAAFQMQSSEGNPEKLKKAQELITSCIMGLMLIIFSVFILRLIGVDILRIPGFG
ncbi:hypothetical protein M1328_01960 [Patescibacteria group bacterium]|nr:hypothetical protein [Patescibacteria group bacterium]